MKNSDFMSIVVSCCAEQGFIFSFCAKNIHFEPVISCFFDYQSPRLTIDLTNLGTAL